MISVSLGINPHECEAMFEHVPDHRAQERVRQPIISQCAPPRPRPDLAPENTSALLAKNLFLFGQCMEGTQFYGLFGMILSASTARTSSPASARCSATPCATSPTTSRVFRNLFMDLSRGEPATSGPPDFKAGAHRQTMKPRPIVSWRRTSSATACPINVPSASACR